ncbi:chromosome partitioning protein [Plantactinospora sp. B5E13]|uniref:MinD/ParA family ATP-binding protein n=1 Tax=Plantactinospora sp. B5E13 TaxID=3153758 RepID=UPI00325CB208
MNSPTRVWPTVRPSQGRATVNTGDIRQPETPVSPVSPAQSGASAATGSARPESPDRPGEDAAGHRAAGTSPVAGKASVNPNTGSISTGSGTTGSIGISPTAGKATVSPNAGKASVNPNAGKASVSPGTGSPKVGTGTDPVAPGPAPVTPTVADPAREQSGEPGPPGGTAGGGSGPGGTAGSDSGLASAAGSGSGAEAGAPPADRPEGAAAPPDAARPVAPIRGRATLPGAGRATAPEAGAIPRPTESPWAQPPQRPTTAPPADPSAQPGAGQPPTGTGQPAAGHAPAGQPAAGTPQQTGGAEAAPVPTPPIGPYPPTMTGGYYSATARPASAYPPPVPPQVPPPPVPHQPAYPPPPGPTYPPAPTYPTPPGYPSYPPAPPVPGPPDAAAQSPWAPVPPQVPGPGPVPPHHPGATEVPPQPHVPAPPVPGYPAPPVPGYPAPPTPSYPDPLWTPDGGTPTAEEFAQRRAVRPADPVAQTGVRAVVNKSTLGLVKLAPGRHEQEIKQDIEMIRRNFGGLRQVTVVNPKGGAGKTVAILLLAMTFGQKRGGYVLAWDNNETQGTLGMRAQQDFHSRTVRDLLRDLYQFKGAHGRVGDLSQYVRSQSEGMFDVLASDESATGGEMLTAAAFAELREVVSRFYKLIFVDTGNNVRAQNWQAAIDATDQLVVTMSARNDSAETAARMLDHLEQSGRQRLVRQAVTVVSMPPSRKEIDLPPIQRHFAARTRVVLTAPYERLIDTGEPIRYAQLSSATRDAWLKIAAAVAEGL